MWYNCIVQEQQGIVTKDAVMMLHEDMKRRFLPVREGKSFGETVYVTASTRDLDTVEFTRFLDKVNGLAAEHGISLPWPDDLAFVAFSEHYYPLIDDQMKKSA